jgi:hypothetical protein
VRTRPRVVQHAVIEAVAVDRLADSEMIEMRRKHDMLTARRASLPGSRATMLGEVTLRWRVTVVARSDCFISNWGAVSMHPARAEISAKVRPERAKSFCEVAVLKLALKKSFCTSRMAGSAKYMPDWSACAIPRIQGVSMAFSLVSVIMPGSAALGQKTGPIAPRM